jgi:PAS domain-containing protein
MKLLNGLKFLKRSKKPSKLVELAAALSEHKRVLEEKKTMLHEECELLASTITDTMLEAASVISKLRSDVSSYGSLLASIAGDHTVHGVAFVNYRGEILFANAAAHKLIGVGEHGLIGTKIECFVLGGDVRLFVEECSQRLIKQALNGELCRLDEARLSLLNKAPIQVYLANTKHPLCISGDVRLSLLDAKPKSIEDITYICKF